MSNDLSFLTPVHPDQGKAQWVQGKVTGIDKTSPTRTHLIGVPDLMPGTVIFVHGVNSEGEWYSDAARQFCEGLNARLGRVDLKSSIVDQYTKRFKDRTESGEKPRSPVIPFYWGYSVPPEKRLFITGTDINCKADGSMGAFCDKYGNRLRKDGSWGGGPFQNGTGTLPPFWHEEGFRKKIIGGLIDVDKINPIVGRHLLDCPDRLYYVHAARRLANLVKTIRQDLPNEPINIVAHSQGTMIALCALFYLDADKVRGPDTVILNSSPYHFDTKLTDYLTTAGGAKNVQGEEARIQTFARAAKIVQDAKDNFEYQPAPKAECSIRPVHRHVYDDCIFVHKPTDIPKWQAEIGAEDIDPKVDGKKWWQDPMRARDNRGKLFVNFNPGDRVIGVSAVGGLGWRGIPPKYMGKLGGNVMQRMFARSSNDDHNPAVGSKTGYEQAYFYTQMDRNPVVSGQNFDGPVWTTGSGAPLITQNENWHYLDGGSPNGQWFIASEKVLGLVPALGSVSPRGDGGKSEYVTINAPLVPEPAKIGDDFDGAAIRYDGQADVDADGKPLKEDKEQQADFDEDVRYEARRQITDMDERGLPFKRWERYDEVEDRLRADVGHRVISPTNHAAILRYSNPKTNTGLVSHVMSYDLTVGQGYAWGDANYWNYLLDLADWRESDPYYLSGTLKETFGDVPPGIDPATSTALDDPRPAAAPAARVESLAS